MTFVESIEHGISVIDTGFVRERFDASFLIVEKGRAAYVDTGTNFAVPRLLGALRQLELDEAAVDWVVLTHVHLDHAGGAGLLMEHLPNAKLVIHPRGARHMIDPSVLMEAVRAVYGDEVANRDYGELRPVPAARVVTTTDGMVLELAGRPLRFVDSPGHAKHHHCIWDEASRGWFTGDTFGLMYPELKTPLGPHVVPTTSPVQFDPGELHATLDKLVSARPQVLYVTHYGAIRYEERLAAQLLSQVDAMVVAARQLEHAEGRHEKLKQACESIYLTELRRCGSKLEDAVVRQVLATDIELNAQGLVSWLERVRR
jgi:glyoxylase-like metal-dependent hydrolase (beta-lactamase superfamily II)